MGYFANSTEGELFREHQCYKCKNWRNKKDGRGYGCPIMDLHLAYGYKLCNSRSIAKKMLDILIKNDGNCINDWKCEMFLNKRVKK